MPASPVGFVDVVTTFAALGPLDCGHGVYKVVLGIQRSETDEVRKAGEAWWSADAAHH
jgi:hypothetical protein